MKLAHYSNENGEKEFVVAFNDLEEANDFIMEGDGFHIESITIVPDISGFPMNYKLVRE